MNAFTRSLIFTEVNFCISFALRTFAGEIVEVTNTPRGREINRQTVEIEDKNRCLFTITKVNIALTFMHCIA